ncbi:MAG: Crp/Fnr family transcriptional regulator [Flavobacteriaceae bacterium]
MEHSVLHTIFAGDDSFTSEESQRIISSYERVSFSKMAFLSKAGEKVNHYYFLEEGYIRSFATDQIGDEITTHFYLRGDAVIDWAAFLQRVPSKQNFQAQTDTTCWRIDFDKFQMLFHSIKGYRERGRAQLTQAYFNLAQKNLSHITDTAKDRYLNLIKQKPLLLQYAKLQHISSYLGVTRSSLSRVRREIAQKN